MNSDCVFPTEAAHAATPACVAHGPAGVHTPDLPPVALPGLAPAILRPGEVALIGAGPGDPELLTLRAWRLLQQADAVVHDRLVSPQLLELLPAGCERHETGKSSGYHTLPQEGINALLVLLARRGQRVVRLKGGDPFIFGRGGEEIAYLLEQGIACQVVPGVTAASGCAAYAGIPLTHRGMAHSCQFITGHFRKGEDLHLPWAALACPDQTLVFYMGLANLAHIALRLQEAGLPASTPAAIVDRGTTAQQRVVRGTLAGLPELAIQHALQSPALTIVGKVVDLFAGVPLEFAGRLLPAALAAVPAAAAAPGLVG